MDEGSSVENFSNSSEDQPGEDGTEDIGEEETCRLCFDTEVDPSNDPLLEPCDCIGSMRFIHASCLFESRVNSFNPRTLDECGLCRSTYTTIDSLADDASQPPSSSARRELYWTLLHYVGLRLAIFSLTVVCLGFAPGLFYGIGLGDLPDLSENKVINHLFRGFISSLTLAGGWAIIQVYASIGVGRIFFRHDFFGYQRPKEKDGSALMAVMVVIGKTRIVQNEPSAPPLPLKVFRGSLPPLLPREQVTLL